MSVAPPIPRRLLSHPAEYTRFWGFSIINLKAGGAYSAAGAIKCAICAAGNDCRVSFYDRDGHKIQDFDHSGQPGAKEFTVAAFNPSGESVGACALSAPRPSLARARACGCRRLHLHAARGIG